MPPKNKVAWRQHFKDRAATLPHSTQKDLGQRLNQHLIDSELFASAQHIALYWSIQPEPCLKQIIGASRNAGKTLLLPRFDKSLSHYIFSVWETESELEIGPYKIPQPPANEKGKAPLDLILVPGLAFDDYGNRLGHGAGIYDRLLAEESAPRIGVAFEYQRVPTLPAEKHDCEMDYLLTEMSLLAL